LIAACVESIFIKACRLDVVAFKPGNVSLYSAGHGMRAEDFLISARAAAPALAAPSLEVGERIYNAVAATRAAVGCNTNLGIVLLLAPIASAVGEFGGGELRARLAAVLDRLTVDDAERCYAAIRRAEPAGMGHAAEQDVALKPSVNLREAMRLARSRDTIARQYVTDFEDVFSTGIQTLTCYRSRWHSLAWACSACYLSFLGSHLDSHVVRKHGSAVAKAVRQRAREVEKAFKACENPRRLRPVLKAFDKELKTRGVNPGTSADLTVASVSVLLLQERLGKKPNTRNASIR
jgi:triphosphoribosyl-dephospho-CoA synthase